MGLFDTLTAGVGKLGQAAGQAIDETRLQMQLIGARKRKDTAARDLGYLVFRISQGALVSPGEQESLVRRIGDAEKEVEKLEADVRNLRAGKGAPPPAEPPKADPPKDETPATDPPKAEAPSAEPATAGPDGAAS